MILLFIRTEKSIAEFRQSYPIVFSLVIINIALWFLVYIVPFSFGKELFIWGAGHNYSINYYNEYWRFITPIFLHGGLTHTVFNSFALVIFGPGLERMLNKGNFISVYLLAGIIGNIGTYVVDPSSTITHIGASGSVYGLFGVYMFIIWRKNYLIDRANSQIVMTIFFLGLVMTFIRPGINISAHVFGFLGGLLIAPLFLKNARPFYERW